MEISCLPEGRRVRRRLRARK